MSSKLIGTWQSESCENMDDLLKAFGVNFILRKIILQSCPKLTISKNDGQEWSLTLEMKLRKSTVKFHEMEPVEEEFMDGRKAKSTFKFEGDNKLIQRMDFIGSDDVQIVTRELTADGRLKQSMEYKGVVGIRIYNRL